MKNQANLLAPSSPIPRANEAEVASAVKVKFADTDTPEKVKSEIGDSPSEAGSSSFSRLAGMGRTAGEMMTNLMKAAMKEDTTILVQNVEAC